MPTFGVLGSGEVGQVLAKGLKDHGYEVRIGSRTPAKLAEYAKRTGITAGTFAEVGRWGEALVLSVKGDAAEPVLALVGRDGLGGKLIIDTTNPLTDDPPQQGVLHSFTGPNESLMERLQRAYPDGRFVKAFNCVGSARMVDPKFAGGRPTMFYCGDNAEAKATVARVLEQFGWEAADMGVRSVPVRSSRWPSSGASRGFCRTAGRTRSSCCGSSPAGAQQATAG
jgi:predicted dinucleotide-binding enzyme